MEPTDKQIERVAMICYEVNRAYCSAIGDDSQPPWAEAPEWQKERVYGGIQFAVNHRFSGNDKQHNNWMSCKLREGWRYGPIKDVINKIHPCLLPHNELSKEQKLKDRLFVSIVDGLLPMQQDSCEIGPVGP